MINKIQIEIGENKYVFIIKKSYNKPIKDRKYIIIRQL